MNDPTIVEMMTWLIQLNPYFRCSASELIKHKIFDRVRQPLHERSSPIKINLEIDQDNAFDYDLGSSLIFTLKQYQTKLLNEVSRIHKQWESNVAMFKTAFN